MTNVERETKGYKTLFYNDKRTCAPKNLINLISCFLHKASSQKTATHCKPPIIVYEKSQSVEKDYLFSEHRSSQKWR